MRIFTRVPGIDIYIDLDSAEELSFEKICTLESLKIINKYIIKYLKYGKLHRTDGPAVLWMAGNTPDNKVEDVFFYFDGAKYEESDWFKLLSKEDRIKYLFKKDEYE